MGYPEAHMWRAFILKNFSSALRTKPCCFCVIKTLNVQHEIFDEMKICLLLRFCSEKVREKIFFEWVNCALIFWRIKWCSFYWFSQIIRCSMTVHAIYCLHTLAASVSKLYKKINTVKVFLICMFIYKIHVKKFLRQET